MLFSTLDSKIGPLISFFSEHAVSLFEEALEIVKVTINGKNNVTSINIDDSVIDKNEKEILEDLIMAAFNDAKEKIQKKIADEMSSVTGGLKLPPGMKLPF